MRRNISDRSFVKYDDLNASVQENVSAIREKAYVREEYEKRTLHKSYCKPLQNVCGRREGADSNAPLMKFTVYSCILGISWLGSKDDRRKHADDRRSDEPSGILYEYPDEPDDAFHGICYADDEFMPVQNVSVRCSMRRAGLTNPENAGGRSQGWKHRVSPCGFCLSGRRGRGTCPEGYQSANCSRRDRWYYWRHRKCQDQSGKSDQPTVRCDCR